MPADPRALYDTLAQQLTADPTVTLTKMFGMPSIKHGDKAIAGYFKGAMVFKLDGAAHADALALDGARIFDPSGMGRPMKQWVEVPAAHAEAWPRLAEAALRTTPTGK